MTTRQELLAIIDQAASEAWTTLDLSRKGIRELPDEIGQLASLERLYLYNNQLTALPETLGQLASLQKLHVSSTLDTPLTPVMISSDNMYYQLSS